MFGAGVSYTKEKENDYFISAGANVSGTYSAKADTLFSKEALDNIMFSTSADVSMEKVLLQSSNKKNNYEVNLETNLAYNGEIYKAFPEDNNYTISGGVGLNFNIDRKNSTQKTTLFADYEFEYEKADNKPNNKFTIGFKYEK